jgi:hypothetical protein
LARKLVPDTVELVKQLRVHDQAAPDGAFADEPDGALFLPQPVFEAAVANLRETLQRFRFCFFVVVVLFRWQGCCVVALTQNFVSLRRCIREADENEREAEIDGDRSPVTVTESQSQSTERMPPKLPPKQHSSDKITERMPPRLPPKQPSLEKVDRTSRKGGIKGMLRLSLDKGTLDDLPRTPPLTPPRRNSPA